MKPTTRSVRDIQQELDGINQFLKSKEDTYVQFSLSVSFSNLDSLEISLEIRRQIIAEYKSKRDDAQAFKKIYEQCSRQVQVNTSFLNDQTNMTFFSLSLAS